MTPRLSISLIMVALTATTCSTPARAHPTGVFESEYCVTPDNDAELRRIASERGLAPQDLIQQLLNGFVAGQSANKYNAGLQEFRQRAREACKAGVQPACLHIRAIEGTK